MLVDEFLPGAVDLAVLVFASILLYVFNPIAAAIVTSSILVDFFIRASGFSSEKISAAKLIDARLQQSAYLQEAVRGFQSIKLAGGEATRFAQWESRVIELADIESKIAHERAIRNSLSSILLPIEFSCLIFFTSTNAVTAPGVAALFGIFAFRSIIKERALSVTNLVPSFFHSARCLVESIISDTLSLIAVESRPPYQATIWLLNSRTSRSHTTRTPHLLFLH